MVGNIVEKMSLGIKKSTASVDKIKETLKKQMENITLSGNYRFLAEIQFQAYLVGRNL